MQDNLPALDKPTDMTPSELQRVQQFVDEGLPGLDQVDDAQLYKMMDMYLTGSTYFQISTTLRIKKNLVLYLAHKFDWYLTKRDYMNELQHGIKHRVADAKISNQNFMLLLVQAWQKKVGKQLSEYLATGNEEHMDLDMKELAQLVRSIEHINELDKEPSKSPRSPAVGLNVGDGVTIEKTGENKLTITPKEATIGSKLQQMADMRREMERQAKVKKSSDIEQDQGDPNNENQ